MSFLYTQHTTSNVRAEPIYDRPVRQPHSGLFPVLSQGEAVDGSVSADHPAIRQYIDRLEERLNGWKEYHRSGPMAWPWHTTDGRCVSWWAAEKAAVVRAGDSWEVCHDHVDRMLNIGELRLPTIKAVFALAALKVLRSPHDLVFWAFWGLKAAERTAELVDEVVNTHPSLITLPDSVVWTDKASALAAITEIRRPLLPTAVYPTQYISANLHLFTEDPKPTKAAKRKRTTADVDVAQPAAKKARTRTARCTAPKPQGPLGPQRKSVRLQKDAVQAAAAPQPPAGTALAGTETTDVGADVVDVEVEDGVEAEVKIVKVIAAPKRRRATAKRLTQKKGKSRAKKTAPATAPEDAITLTLQEVIPEVVPPSSGRIRIPARPVNSQSAVAPTPLLAIPTAPSPAATAAGTSTPLEGVTCVNTPSKGTHELPKIQLEQVDAKLTATAKAPVRTSVRIREKKAAKSV
ncbi:hypothetical protein L227DRAFT_657907 [Lentinus tigrinus ALCF2SS1-6]|uniref:Uncharacterized protein n=1 Tax=Lentinus tigrinus ALCF2SS1-6 TaxID=1328759 RepID=A0A5C2RR15_9APHY|nr:hypothetical protein L227DRAFT_657907 [Lentinus tigrinus ALCF2SS1-6]